MPSVKVIELVEESSAALNLPPEEGIDQAVNNDKVVKSKD